jgi:hypothetical protein
MRRISSCSDRLQAEIVASFLEDSGIAVELRSDDAGGLNTAMTAANGVHLFVHENQLDEARKILESEFPEKR